MAGEIFISYRRADMAWAKLLHDQLRAEGVEAWYDAQIGAGQDWRVATANALENSRIFVLLFTANAAMSSDIAKELAAAVLEKKLIVPVRLENIQPKGAFLYELASRNWPDQRLLEETPRAEAKPGGTGPKGLAQIVRTGTHDESVLPFEGSGGAKPAPPAVGKRKTIPALIAGAALVVAAGAGLLFWQHTRPAAAPPQTQPAASRVAVLPFETLGGNDRDARSFSDTISESIVAALNDGQVQTISREDAKTLSGTRPRCRCGETGRRVYREWLRTKRRPGPACHRASGSRLDACHANVDGQLRPKRAAGVGIPIKHRGLNRRWRQKPRSTRKAWEGIPRKWMTRPWALLLEGSEKPMDPDPGRLPGAARPRPRQSLPARPNTPGAI